MTANNPNYWRPGNYAQPLVNNPPNGQRANNSRHAIWHFSRPIPVEVYPAGAWREEDGRYDRGQATLIVIYGVAQPFGERTNLRTELPEGESMESKLVVHVDSHQPENIAVAQAHPDIFPNGVFLAGVGKTANFDTRGFGMLIQYRGLRWRVQDYDVFENAGDEEVDFLNAMHRGVCTLFTDIQQEMEADKTAEIIAP